jgi:succinoglycan biosynthesis protein ExoA
MAFREKLKEQPMPFVTVIVPIRNEAEYIERCLRSILNNDYPADRTEVIVADGMSDDGTRDIVKRMAVEDSRVRLIDNPHRIVPHAMNKAICESVGEVIVRMDGHSTVNVTYISECVLTLLEHPDVWRAGGVIHTDGINYMGRVIATAMASRMGVGSSWRMATKEGYADDVAFGAWWRWVYDKIGLFDEQLARNQDADIIQRIREHGGRQYLNPRAQAHYYCRGSLSKLARQWYQNGYWRPPVLQKRERLSPVRQVVPLLFILGWIGLVVSTLLWRPLWPALAAYAGAYLLGLIIGAAGCIRRAGWRIGLMTPAVFMILHFAYGLGWMAGIWSWAILRGKFAQHPETHGITR